MSHAINRLLSFCCWNAILKILGLPNRGLQLGPLAQQAGILPLDHSATTYQNFEPAKAYVGFELRTILQTRSPAQQRALFPRKIRLVHWNSQGDKTYHFQVSFWTISICHYVPQHGVGLHACADKLHFHVHIYSFNEIRKTVLILIWK